MRQQCLLETLFAVQEDGVHTNKLAMLRAYRLEQLTEEWTAILFIFFTNGVIKVRLFCYLCFWSIPIACLGYNDLHNYNSIAGK